ncbi:MAG: sulfur carrier protein ThiS [Chitinivibrionales bacterium]|nr:sulfur carrier protein ThiS [Chitinivibrionales bacterium]
MKITINGQEKQMGQEPVSVEELLAIEKVDSPDMVSVQLNGTFVKRELFPETQVNENDELEFLYFMGGGSAA